MLPVLKTGIPSLAPQERLVVEAEATKTYNLLVKLAVFSRPRRPVLSC